MYPSWEHASQLEYPRLCALIKCASRLCSFVSRVSVCPSLSSYSNHGKHIHIQIDLFFTFNIWPPISKRWKKIAQCALQCVHSKIEHHGFFLTNVSSCTTDTAVRDPFVRVREFMSNSCRVPNLPGCADSLLCCNFQQLKAEHWA